jgi:hypothetical protein
VGEREIEKKNFSSLFDTLIASIMQIALSVEIENQLLQNACRASGNTPAIAVTD